jgi:hypothetical protein
MPPVIPPFLVGLIVAPLAKRIAKPLLRGIVKTSVGLVVEVKKVAQEAGEGLQDLAAEVTAEMGGTDLAHDTSGGIRSAKPRPATPVPAGSGSK